MLPPPNLQPVAHGIDLVEISRFARALASHPERFAERVFTAAERAYADANPKRRLEHLAVRFAAKEAVLKALGTGWSQGIAWTDVETLREPDGPPTVRLENKAAAVAEVRGITRWLLSLSHTESYAMASVIACRAV